MTNHVIKLLNIYTYQSDRSNWTGTLPANVNIMSYQLDGRYDHSFNFGVLEVKKDHVFNIGASDSYSVHRVESGKSICITFTSDTPIKTELFDCSGNPRVAILFKRLLAYRSLGIESNYYMALSIIYEIFYLLNKNDNSVNETNEAKYGFDKAREYIHKNFYDSEIDLTQLIKASGLCDKYFRETFQKLYGSTPTQYLINLRLNEAANLLSQGVLSVTEVAETVGFSDVYYFSRLFKKKFSVSPSFLKNRNE